MNQQRNVYNRSNRIMSKPVRRGHKSPVKALHQSARSVTASLSLSHSWYDEAEKEQPGGDKDTSPSKNATTKHCWTDFGPCLDAAYMFDDEAPHMDESDDDCKRHILHGVKRLDLGATDHALDGVAYHTSATVPLRIRRRHSSYGTASRGPDASQSSDGSVTTEASMPSCLLFSPRLCRDSLTSLSDHMIRLSHRIRRDSLTSLDHGSDHGSSTTEESTPQSSVLFQCLRRDSLTSLDHTEHTMNSEDSMTLLPLSLRLTRRRHSTSAFPPNCRALAWLDRGSDHGSTTTEESIPQSSVLLQRLCRDSLTSLDHTEHTKSDDSMTPLPSSLRLTSRHQSTSAFLTNCRPLTRLGSNRHAAGSSVETDDSISVSASVPTLPIDSLHSSDSSLDQPPLSHRRLQDSLLLARYNSSGSEIDMSDSDHSAPRSQKRLQDSLLLSRYNDSCDSLHHDSLGQFFPETTR